MSSTPAKIGFIAAPFAVGALLIAMLSGTEGDKRRPYLDAAGVWTVCKGVTGTDVIPGRVYTDAECAVLEVRYIDRMLVALGQCVPTALPEHQILAFGHFAYNVGTAGFCGSSVATHLRAGRTDQACQAMAAWRSIARPAGMADTAPGAWRTAPSLKHPNGRPMFRCDTPGNRVCAGLWTRRQQEIAMCLGQAA